MFFYQSYFWRNKSTTYINSLFNQKIFHMDFDEHFLQNGFPQEQQILQS